MNNYDIYKSNLVTNVKLESYNNISCFISGGSDSDIMLDLVYKNDIENKVKYVMIDTGLEYDATKRHISYLGDKYGIEINVLKPHKSIPTCCKEYGVPFISKYVSEMINRLQRHNFKWEDKSYEELIVIYPKCLSALKWWCNQSKMSAFNVQNNKLLKEFLMQNNPTFNISNKCCKYAKKNVSNDFIKSNNIQMNITGIRKCEGGIRKQAYKNCFSENEDTCDEYRPIFWYKDDTKRIYKDDANITYSDCYEVYGLKRTGCCGCPYNRNFNHELEVIKKHETKLYNAVISIFGESYEYTNKYIEFKGGV